MSRLVLSFCLCVSFTGMCTGQRFYCHSVNMHVPRLGGGFGGKQVTSIFPASAAALAATCTGRSVSHFTCSPVSVGGWGWESGVEGIKQMTSIFPASAAALAATCTGRSVPHFTCSPVSVGGCNVEGGGVKRVIFISQPPVTLPLQFTCTVHLCLLGAGQWGGGGVLNRWLPSSQPSSTIFRQVTTISPDSAGATYVCRSVP